MLELTAARGAAADARPSAGLYRAVWRWHFYAGLLVLPFMLLLAVTGGVYLFHEEIDGLLQRRLRTVPEANAVMLSASALVDAAAAARPGTPTRYLPPASPSSSAEVDVKTPGGEERSVFLDPHDGRVLGEVPYRGTAMWIVRKIHSLAWFGTWPSYVIEIVGGWAIVLVATGFYPWWPRRGRRGGMVTMRGTPAKRVFWRDLHAVTGAFAGLVVGFLALTGMPWSAFWGQQANKLLAGAGLGYPAAAYDDVPTSTVPAGKAVGQVGWTLENSPMPMSSPGGHAGHQGGGAPAAAPGPAPEAIGLDRAVAAFDGLGIARGYAVDLPKDATGVYTATVFPRDLSRQRIIHLDQYSGRPLVDLRVADYGAGARAIEWGINVHMGQEFGLANQLLMLATCVAIVLMSVSAAVMWWKRRPRGSLGAPPMPDDPRLVRGLLAVMVAAGIAFPLTGLSLLVVLSLDRLLPRPFRARVA